MNLSLTPFLVLAAVMVLTIVVLIVLRQAIARREDDTLHVLHGATAVPEQESVAHKLDAIDKWGKLLTIVTVVYGGIVGALFVYQQWLRASNLGR
jgi:hypothetical protein